MAGKGIGASLITASVKAMTPLIAADHSLIETVQLLNEKLCNELVSREFVALSIALFDTASGDIEIANCGLPDPYWIGCETSTRAIDVPGPRLPLGVRRDVTYQTRRLTLAEGDRLLLLTDGLPESCTQEGEPLGYERLLELVGAPATDADPSRWLDQLMAAVRRATTPENEDDLTALVLERVGGDIDAVSRPRPTAAC